MIIGIVLIFVTLAFYGASTNRHVRGRLRGAIVAFALYAILAATLRYSGLSGGMEEALRLIAPLFLGFGGINALVALAINPWRIDRLPDRFPTIVQDTIVIALFAVVAAIILQERVFTTTAVGAVVIGFALQDTLGNLFAGLAIQIEKPFRVGHWVHIGGKDGLVTEITWRATKLRTKAGNFVIVPNSALSRDTIMNYSEPSAETRIEVEVGASYDVPPNEVKATILAAIRDEPLISRSKSPEVLLVDFAASAIVYRIRVWTIEFAADEQLRDHIRSAVYYAFRRSGIVIPYPIQVEIQEEAKPSAADSATAEQLLQQVSILSALTDDERAELARGARRSLFAAGETIVRQGEAGSSMFVVSRGAATVTLEPGNQEVARIERGGFFGEMSLLTGDPRSATVRTAVDSELLEITVEAFRRFVLANPSAVDQIGEAVAVRRAELSQHVAVGVGEASTEPSQRFLFRVRRFLGLSVS
jgi:small-conductance mechanosensitive channel/CRP-like cAMP-binding protein